MVVCVIVTVMINKKNIIVSVYVLDTLESARCPGEYPIVVLIFEQRAQAARPCELH